MSYHLEVAFLASQKNVNDIEAHNGPWNQFLPKLNFKSCFAHTVYSTEH